jgi:hypothetical protein
MKSGRVFSVTASIPISMLSHYRHRQAQYPRRRLTGAIKNQLVRLTRGRGDTESLEQKSPRHRVLSSLRHPQSTTYAHTLIPLKPDSSNIRCIRAWTRKWRTWKRWTRKWQTWNKRWTRFWTNGTACSTACHSI